MAILVFILGLCFGSFINVLIDRIPKERSIIGTRSKCDHCKRTIAWKDLIPVVSFILLFGRCRYCKKQISFFYPLVELTTAFAFLFVYTYQSETLSELFFHLFVISMLIAIFFTDIKYGIIPDKILFPLTLITFLYLAIYTPNLILSHFLTAFGSFLFFLLLFLITMGKGMGLGDVKLSFFMGLLLGFPNVVVAHYIAFVSGALVAILLVFSRRKKFIGSTIAFGPFMVFGTIVSLYAGNVIFWSVLRNLLKIY